MKYLIFTLSLMAIVSCKDNNPKETITNVEAVERHDDVSEEHAHHEESNIYSNTWKETMVMNNGDKWQSDFTTNEGVKMLQKTLSTQATNTLEDYHQLANGLNDDKNYLVKNCTMQGPAHDNLHTWLHPLIEKIAALTQTETVAEASKIKASIAENINGYYDYFK